jgi:hypothetical protein
MRIENTMTENEKPEATLKEFFDRNGCVRVRVDDPEHGRHGGAELRLVVANVAERKTVLAALRALKIPHGRVYRKQRSRRQWVVPIYSREDILAFLRLVGPEDAAGLSTRVMAAAKRKVVPAA